MSRIIKWKQLTALLYAHTLEILRLPEVLFWGIVFPILLTLGLGLAFTSKGEAVRHIAVVSDGARADSSFSNFLTDRTKKIGTGAGATDYVYSVRSEKLGDASYIFSKTSWDSAVVSLKRGEISLIIEDKGDGLKYRFDPMNSEAQLTYLNLSKALNRAPVETGADRENIEPMTLAGTRYVDFLVPGLMAMGVMMSSVWGLTYGIIDKRSKKLLRRMVATPMKKSHYLMSLMAVRSTMNLIEATLLFVFAYFFFGVSIQGSLLALALLFITSNMAFQGISVFMASRTSSTEVANGFINAVTTPMMILSGIFFSYQNFPDWAVAFIKLLPLTILADAVRAVFIEGAGLARTAFPIGVLFVIGVFFFSIGLKMFKWR
ncbi:MAG: ABC transporter permease [Chloroflexota bacterium]